MNHFFKNKRILVAGGAGFIGTNLILKLFENKAKVRATIHNAPPQIKNSKIEFVKADLTNPADCKRIVENIDYVFMCAANTSGAAVIEKTPLVHVTSHVIPALIRKVVERQKPLEVWGDGKDIKDFIYVEDLVEGLMLALEKINKFDQINIGGGKPVTVRQVLKAILNADNFKNPKIVFNSSKPTMIPIRLININKAKKILGFTSKTSIKDGIKRTVDYYKSVR